MNARLFQLVLCAWAAMGLPSRAVAEPPAAESVAGKPSTADSAFFTAKIRPVFQEICWKCHGPETAENNLRLDSRAAMLKGGDSGPAVVPGKPAESLLVHAIRYDDDPQMPPDEKLADSAIDDFTAWVRDGAAWSDDEVADPKKAAESEKPYWTFQPIASPQPPADPDGWSETAIDQFLHAKQRAAGLAPAADADKRTLIRRATFDLTGLPASPDEIQAFLAEASPDTWQRVVDRLLDSPRYGERWARHWLDVVRYADAGGFEHDIVFPNAWRYRDYVIRSFNADKPFDRFIQEQIAGDELWPGDKEAALGTGMYCIAPVQEEAAGSQQLERDWLTDAADTTGAAFLALTMGCARCHNHKYDPITQVDYYSLQAFFAASDRSYSERVRNQRIKALNGILSEGPPPKELLNDPRCTLRTDEKAGFGLFHRDEPLEMHRLNRGELGQPREVVSPAFPAVVAGKSTADDAQLAAPDGRRAALARWVTSPENPLTARVLANRVWGWHFGQGLVRTPNDFGKQGDPPSHPELLDWLAHDLIDHGWSLKHLQRRILLSRAYRISSVASAADVKVDPENRLLARFPRRRHDAEEVRDSLLACAGTLNPAPFGPPVKPPLSKQELSGLFEGEGRWPVDKDNSQHSRRSIYVFVRRSFTYPLFATFDSPNNMVSCSRRNATIVPTQALALLNSPFAQEQAAIFARRVRGESSGTPESAIARAWLLAFGRPATAAETERAIAFLRDRAAVTSGLDDAPTNLIKADQAWAELCLALLNTNEFIYID